MFYGRGPNATRVSVRPAPPFLIAIMFFAGIAIAIGGIVLLVSGTLGSLAFSHDASCSSAISVATPPGETPAGACEIRPATIASTYHRRGRRSSNYYITVRRDDGVSFTVYLAGNGASSMYYDARGRIGGPAVIETFHRKAVMLATAWGSSIAADYPQRAIWNGAGLLAFGVVFAVFAGIVRNARRAAARSVSVQAAPAGGVGFQRPWIR